VARQLPLSLFKHSLSQNITCFTRKRVSLRNLKKTTKATMATTDSTNPLLLTQKDWPLWFQFIRRKASFAKIWDYVDPDKTENEIKENNKPAIPSIATAPAAPAAAPTTPAAAPIAPAATPASTGTATPRSSSQQGQQT
jgi:hypothetical protein